MNDSGQLTVIRENILRQAGKIRKQQLIWRRHFHRHPELSFREFETTARLKEIIRQLGLKQLPLKMETGLLAELTGRKNGPTVAIRTDIDALPITEQTNLPFKSKIDGCMHACGHDMHMAIVLGAAAILSTMKSELPGNVRFIFQPAEEMPPGGARPMIANGALDDVSMIFGLHVDPNLAVGKIGLRDGMAMASVTDFDLIIHGRAGHAARPQDGVDAIAVAAEVIESIQKIVSREIDPITPAVITFGKISGGMSRNTIANRVVLNGTARALSDRTDSRIRTLVKRTASSVCRARGARAEMNIVAGYPALANDARVNKLLDRNFVALYGPRNVKVTELVMGAEDFACYLKEVPGAMFRLGIRNKKIGANKPWHSPMFVADETALSFGSALLAAAAFDALSSLDQ